MRISGPAPSVSDLWDTLVADLLTVGSIGELLAVLTAARIINLDNIGKGGVVVAGDALLLAHDAEVCATNETLTNAKEIIIVVAGVYRISFDAKSTQTDAINRVQIYNNGVIHGTRRDNLPAGYITYTEDLIFKVGDLLTLRIAASVGDTVCSENLRLKGEIISSVGVVTA